MKLATDIHHVREHCWKRFARSEVKGQVHDQTNWPIMAEAYISTVWRH